MKKFLFSVCLSLLGVHALAAAAPFALTTDTRFNHLTHKILAQEPIYFYLNDDSLEEGFYEKITEWFSHPLTLASGYTENSLQPVEKYLQHGQNRATYQRVFSPEKADLSIYVESNHYFFSKCGRHTVGCLKANNVLYLRQSADTQKKLETLQHELGHAFGLEDLYYNQYPSNGPTYGSGVQESIMLYEGKLTCDDADGIVNSLWLALKQKNPDTADFHFTSFCTAKRKFKNAHMVGRVPEHVDHQNTRTVYTYCTDGRPHHILKINPSEPKNLIQIVQAPIDCDYIAKDGQVQQGSALMPTKLSQMPVEKINMPKQPLGQQIFKHFLPTESGPMSVTFVLDSPKVPAYVYMQDETDSDKKPIVYLFAYLDNGYNIAHQFRLPQYDTHGPAGDFFIYKRANPNVYCAWGSPPSASCTGTVKETEEMQNLLRIYHPYFKEKINLPDSQTGWSEMFPRPAIEVAQQWEKVLLENYTPFFILKQRTEAQLNRVFVK